MIIISTRIIHSFDTVDNWNTVNPLIKKGEIIFKEKSNGKVVLAVGNVDGGVNAADAPVVYDEDEINEKLNNLNQAVLDAETYAEEAEQQAELAKNYAESVGIRLQTFTSLEQIGITPGEETFASIHNALPVNSELKYYYQTGYGLNDNGFYPASYGYVRFTKQWATLLLCEFIRYFVAEPEGDNQDSGNGIGIYYSTIYSSSYPNRLTVWNEYINSQGTVSQNLHSTLTQSVINVEAAGDGIADFAGYSKDGTLRVGGLQVAKQSVNDELRSRNVLYVCDDDNVYHSTIYSDWSPSQAKVLTTMQGLVRIPDHIQFAGLDNGQFGFKQVSSGEEVANLPQGTYFFYGTAGKDDNDTQLKGTDFQGFSMRQSGQAMQIVCNGTKVLFRYDDNNTAGTNPQYSAWKQFTLTNA